LYGSPTGNNATLFDHGYNAVLKKAGFAPSEGAKGSANTTDQNVGTWTPADALTDFEDLYSANLSINAVQTPNVENAAPIISYLLAAVTVDSLARRGNSSPS
jgi:D-xylose transport system substrate-binding protein